MLTRQDKDIPNDGNPVKSVRHWSNGSDGSCLGLAVHIWCPGCQSLHAPRFRCPEHGGPPEGPVWDGDPYSDPFTMEPSLLVNGRGGSTPANPRCHSFIRNGQWEFLGDCEHELRGFYPLEPLPNWLCDGGDYRPGQST